MSDIYRPLYVIVEAIEAKCKELLKPPRPLPPEKPRFTMEQLQEVLRRMFDPTITCVRLVAEPYIVVKYPCPYCDTVHSTKIPEWAGRGDLGAQIRAIVDATQKMMESSCNIELGTRL